jgi:cell wall-associated NlpC family hydrolase
MHDECSFFNGSDGDLLSFIDRLANVILMQADVFICPADEPFQCALPVKCMAACSIQIGIGHLPYDFDGFGTHLLQLRQQCLQGQMVDFRHLLSIEAIRIKIGWRALTALKHVSEQPVHGALNADKVRDDLFGSPSVTVLVNFGGKLLWGQRPEKVQGLIKTMLECIDNIVSSIHSFLIQYMRFGSKHLMSYACGRQLMHHSLQTERLAGMLVIALMLVATLSACSATSKYPAPSTASTATVETGVPPIIHTIQVGAFSSAARAARLSGKLRQAGLDAYYFVDTDTLYKVRFERFDTKTAARQRALDLQKHGLIEVYYIVSPRAGSRRSDTAANLQFELVRTAHQFIGTPYHWGGVSAKSGFDCSGLTMTVYRLNGLHLPRSARSQFRAGRAVSKGALRQGDLVFFDTSRRSRVSHVGIYVGSGRFVHAPGRGRVIRTANLNNSYFKRRYVGARRYF